MKSPLLLAALAITAAVGSGCDRPGPGANTPAATTQHDLAVVMAATPAADPSLPDASVALAAADAASAAAS